MILQVSVDSSTNTLINRYVYNNKIVSFKKMLTSCSLTVQLSTHTGEHNVQGGSRVTSVDWVCIIQSHIETNFSKYNHTLLNKHDSLILSTEYQLLLTAVSFKSKTIMSTCVLDLATCSQEPLQVYV